jgi:hypothetical protein
MEDDRPIAKPHRARRESEHGVGRSGSEKGWGLPSVADPTPDIGVMLSKKDEAKQGVLP